MKTKNVLKYCLALAILIVTLGVIDPVNATVILSALPVLAHSQIADGFKQALGDQVTAGSYNYIPSEIRGSYALQTSAIEVTHKLFSQNLASLSNKYHLTNQEGTPGQLSSPEAFRVDGIKFSLISETTGSSGRFPIDVVRDLCMRATFTFKIAGKLEAEGSLLPLVLPMTVWGGYTTAASTATDTTINTLAYLPLQIPVYIASSWNYDVALTYTGLASGIPASSYWTCLLVGIRQTAMK